MRGMRAINCLEQKEIECVQVYLTAEEAAFVIRKLSELLRDPEACDHFHVDLASRDLSFSVVTPSKLAAGGYSPLESQVLAGMCDRA